MIELTPLHLTFFPWFAWKRFLKCQNDIENLFQKKHGKNPSPNPCTTQLLAGLFHAGCHSCPTKGVPWPGRGVRMKGFLNWSFPWVIWKSISVCNIYGCMLIFLPLIIWRCVVEFIKPLCNHFCTTEPWSLNKLYIYIYIHYLPKKNIANLDTKHWLVQTWWVFKKTRLVKILSCVGKP